MKYRNLLPATLFSKMQLVNLCWHKSVNKSFDQISQSFHKDVLEYKLLLMNHPQYFCVLDYSVLNLNDTVSQAC